MPVSAGKKIADSSRHPSTPAARAADKNDKVIYWHRELPPLDAEPAGEHIVETNSMRVKGDLAHRGELWNRCYEDLMRHVQDRLHQEVSRLGGHYAHVLEEVIDSRRDNRSGDVWLRSRINYLLLRRPTRDQGPAPTLPLIAGKVP